MVICAVYDLFCVALRGLKVKAEALTRKSRVFRMFVLKLGQMFFFVLDIFFSYSSKEVFVNLRLLKVE